MITLLQKKGEVEGKWDVYVRGERGKGNCDLYFLYLDSESNHGQVITTGIQ